VDHSLIPYSVGVETAHLSRSNGTSLPFARDRSVRDILSFGFEATFTIENWWQDPGFCSDWETPSKTSKMRALAEEIAQHFGLEIEETKDIYGACAFRLLRASEMIFQVTPEPGSIEVNTPPAFFEELDEVVGPLLRLSEKVGLVTSRAWWYGIRTGTGGGCHLNMAGKTQGTNIWFLEPKLALAYFTLFHNHPCLQYPFMGADIGEGGNCMRLDEHGEKSSLNLERFKELLEKAKTGELTTLDEYYAFLEGVPLREVKHSAPTFRKLKFPEYLVEDRAVEMPRTLAEFKLLCELRIRILDWLRSREAEEDCLVIHPQDGTLHEENLGYSALFEAFSLLCIKMGGLNPEDFRVFFDRQFPVLEGGQSVPIQFQLREGKRPRKVLGVNEASGSLVLSKRIDTSYRRFELHSETASRFRLNGREVLNTPRGVLIDLRIPAQDAQGFTPAEPKLHIQTLDEKGDVIERCTFHLRSFLFEEPIKVPNDQRPLSGGVISPFPYFSWDSLPREFYCI
jgi:hypothetical protein